MDFYLKAYEIDVNTAGERDSNSLNTLILLGRTYHKANNIPKAIECFEKAYSIRLETLGAEHKDTVAVKKLLDEIK